MKGRAEPPIGGRRAMMVGLQYCNSGVRKFHKSIFYFFFFFLPPTPHKVIQVFAGRILVLEETFTGHLKQSPPFTNRKSKA